jgi:excinuclease ABC subunit C
MDIKEKVKQLPSSPGVYLMKDSFGSILYVGKSKNLKSRVQTYFQNSKNHSKKVDKLVHHLKDFDFIVTDTEFEAFMLECKLIKEYQPLYNKLMKNPKSYTYIRIHMEKGMELASEMNKNDNENNFYFGPYTSKSTAEKALQGLKDFFKINCNHPSGNKPCLNYSLGMCIGMCFESSALVQYRHIINRIIHLLEGSDEGVLEEMKQQMKNASESYDFERAVKIRDYIDSINSLLNKEKVIEFTKDNKNIVMIEPLNESLIKLFLIKGNKVLFSEKADLFEPLADLVKIKILDYFNIDSHPSTMELGKDHIDEAQIVYSYLKNASCKYLIIPEKWLFAKNHYKINKALNKLLKDPTLLGKHECVNEDG